MKQYLLSVYQPDGNPPPPEVLEEISRDVRAVDDEMRAAGVWVFAGGLHRAETATVLDPRQNGLPMLDGPYVEGKEHLGGLVIIAVDSLDEAVAWGRKVARATTLPIEVRPFQGEAGD
ncbi:MAG TPA: YciI family protein [Solirubrobacteraceae bacterium]|nr:YciI family protein [Solirubrobacteraceae bacterium]